VTVPQELQAETVRASSTADVRLDRVTKRFDEVVAVDDLSLEIERGRFFAMLGPSGCGKTTTLRMIGGFEEPTAGTIYLGDRAVSGLPPYKRDVNTVFQSYALFPHLTTFENVAFGLRRKRVSKDQIKGAVEEMLELVGLRGLGPRKPRQLSGGQQQRVALARALVCRPQVLLLDEPLGALDLKLRKQMQLFLKQLQHEVGITFVHVTHDQEEAMTMADTIAVMNHGRIEQLGPPSELYERPRTSFGGVEVRVPAGELRGRSGRVAVGVRPEKIRLGPEELNRLDGRVTEVAYVGVATQYVVRTDHGSIQVYLQNSDPGSRALGTEDVVTLSFSPDVAFVVADTEEVEE
jgi:spermidine/putrescine transport system ATP-binding protein